MKMLQENFHYYIFQAIKLELLHLKVLLKILGKLILESKTLHIENLFYSIRSIFLGCTGLAK